MSIKIFYLTCTVLIAMGSVGLGAPLPADATPSFPSSTSSTANWIDNFDSPLLNSRWSWVREDPTHWSLAANPGFIRITSQGGNLRGTNNNLRNLLLTAAPQGNFRVTAKVTINPTQDFQRASLFIYQDDDNYLDLRRIYSTGNWVTSEDETNGITNTESGISETANIVYLRILKSNDTYTLSYSTDALQWNAVRQITMTLVNPKVGMSATNSLTGISEIPADFDFFQLELNLNRLFLPLVIR